MNNVHVDFDDDNSHDGNVTHMRPPPVGEPVASRCRLNEDILAFTEPLTRDYCANNLFLSGQFTNIRLAELRQLEVLRQLCYLDVQILRIIVQPRGENNRAWTCQNTRGEGTRGQSKQVHYSRLFLVRIINDSEMYLLAYVMEAKGSNTTLWHCQPELRDNSEISKGNVFRMLSPRPVEDFMAHGMPLLVTNHPVSLCEQPHTYIHAPIRTLVKPNHSYAFCESGLSLQVGPDFTPIQTSCSGLFCNRQCINNWSNENQRGCGCYVMHHRRSNIAFQHGITLDGLQSENCRVISMPMLSSNKFSKLYLTSFLPPSVTLNQLDMMTEEFHMICTAIERCVEYINQNGGFTAIGWYKNGMINDRTMTEDTRNNSNNNQANQENQVTSGEVNYCVVQLFPTNKDIFDEGSNLATALRLKKFNVAILTAANI